ncbi:MAG: glycosyltransferase family 4 protein, partial [Blastocatellia bacterium]
MNIWLLSSEVPWHEAGGIGRYCLNFATALGKAGHSITWLGFSNREIDRELAPGVRVIELMPPARDLIRTEHKGAPDQHPAWPYNLLSEQAARSWQMAEACKRLLDNGPHPDLIESQEFRGLPYDLLQHKLVNRSPLDRIPVLVQLHSPSFALKRINHQASYRFPHYWTGQMEKFSLLAADALLSPSLFLAEAMRRQLKQDLDIQSIPYPVSLPELTAVEKPANKELIYFGRLELRKGVLPLVRACARMWARGDEFTLTLIGGDTDYTPRNTTVATFIRQRFARWIENGRLVLTGEMPHEAVQQRLQQAWGVVIPSLWENFPNTCIEAMAIGQLVIASRSGGQAEMIETDGVNGLLYDWNVDGDCERQLERALHMPLAQRAEIGQRARQRILSICDPARVVQQRLDHYEEIIHRYKPRRSFPVINPMPEKTQALMAPAETTTD